MLMRSDQRVSRAPRFPGGNRGGFPGGTRGVWFQVELGGCGVCYAYRWNHTTPCQGSPNDPSHGVVQSGGCCCISDRRLRVFVTRILPRSARLDVGPVGVRGSCCCLRRCRWWGLLTQGGEFGRVAHFLCVWCHVVWQYVL